MTPPTATPSHEATAAVVRTILHLVEHGGWIATAALAEKTGIGRDNQRRILVELLTYAWVERSTDEQGDRWICGPGLPRLGLAYLELLNERSRSLRSTFEALHRPLTHEKET